MPNIYKQSCHSSSYNYLFYFAELTRTVNSDKVVTDELRYLRTESLAADPNIEVNTKGSVESETQVEYHPSPASKITEEDGVPIIPHLVPGDLVLKQNDPLPQPQPVQVIIVTKMRSGSSFTGEIFNRNDDFVYYFEPLNEIPVDKTDKTNSFHGTNREVILKGIVNCDFSNFQGFNWWNGRRPRQQCSLSLAYQQSPLCIPTTGFNPRTNMNIDPNFKPISGKTDAQKALWNDDACKSHPNIAIKTVRIADIGALKELVLDPSLNVRIIHLIRDPRAVSNSRTDIHDPDNPTKSCQNIDDQLTQYWINPPNWIKGRYMLLRYEDLAENPQSTVDVVYNFLNLTAPSSVKQWLDKNTKYTKPGDNKWGHTRDSTKTAHAWRTHLKVKFGKILEAQQGCKHVMRLLGYEPVESVAQMRDMKYSTLEKVSYPLHPNRTIN